MSRAGAAVALASIDASEQGIDQIMWIMRPSKLAAIAESGSISGQSWVERSAPALETS
jgi:RNA polymerase sigma-70 factor (ECF subfamily)